MKKILVIQTAFIGDVILATPVISELNRLYPQAEIDVYVKKGCENLLEHTPYINQIYVLDKAKGKLKGLYKILKAVREKRYDLVVNLHRFGSSGLVAGFSRAKLIYGFDKNPFAFRFTKKFPHVIGDGRHEVERNLSLIQEFGALSSKRPELFPSDSDLKKVSKYQGDNYYCLAPASVWYTKQLPEEKWCELIELLKDKGRVYLIGGPNDFDLCERIVRFKLLENVINLAGKLSLMESAALIQGAKRVFVNDSGPLHIASSVNTPVTAFFCSTSPKFGFGPLSEDALIVENEMDCKPCGLHGHKECPKVHFNCGQSININSTIIG
jgi:lipopolysaccharide heptosyltransferase II